MMAPSYGFALGTGSIFMAVLATIPTGSIYAQDAWALPPLEINHQHRIAPAVAAPEDVRTPVENLTYVRDWLGISATDLAKVCGVSRQAVHKWLRQKAEPTRENAQTLRALSRIAESFQNSSLRNGRHLLTVGVKGETLLDAVREGRDYAALLATIIQSAKASQDRYDQSGLAERPQRNQEAWNPYFYPALSPLQRDA